MQHHQKYLLIASVGMSMKPSSNARLFHRWALFAATRSKGSRMRHLVYLCEMLPKLLINDPIPSYGQDLDLSWMLIRLNFSPSSLWVHHASVLYHCFWHWHCFGRSKLRQPPLAAPLPSQWPVQLHDFLSILSFDNRANRPTSPLTKMVVSNLLISREDARSYLPKH